MIAYWEVRVGLVVNDGPAKGQWSYGVKAWPNGSSQPEEWSGLANHEAAAWKAVEALKAKILRDAA